jgi:hypothetical protein
MMSHKSFHTRRALVAGLLTVTVATVALAAAPAVVRACDECQLRKHGTYLGQFTILGNGTVRSFATFKDGKPQAVGVTFSETALTGLPEKLPEGMMTWSTNLALPKEAAMIGLDHIGVDWNPVGHEPAKIYDKPHFDFLTT